jgi:selenide,water dikinase
MARGAGVGIRLNVDAIPVIGGVHGLINDGMVPAGCYRNRDCFQCSLSQDSGFQFSDPQLLPLFDPQTSGGLLIALNPVAAERFLSEAACRNLFAVRIGEVIDSGEPSIVLA